MAQKVSKNKLHKLLIADMIDGLKNKSFSSVDLVQNYLDRIKANDYGAFVTVDKDGAMKAAEESDKKIKSADYKNHKILEGIPLGIKDLFCTKNMKTTAGSRILENFHPSYESTVTSKLLSDGAVFLGKTSMDEFAMGSANTYTSLTKCLNPWDKGRIPGGSSGGSAVAVSAGLCAGSTGSDTGGSIRQPAAHTGIVGVRPTYGRVSRYGMIPFAQSMDQAGVMARSVKDAAILMNSISGYDPLDPTSADVPVSDFVAACDKSVRGMKIGVLAGIFDSNIADSIKDSLRESIEILKNAGCEIVEISIPHMSSSLAVYRVLSFAEAASSLSKYDGIKYGVRENADKLNDIYVKTRTERFGPECRRRILLGTYVLSSENYDIYYSKAVKVRSLIIQDFKNAFKDVDLILMPVTSGPAPRYEDVSDPEKMYLEDLFTLPINIAHIGAISIPTKMDGGLPIGLQLVHNFFQEDKAFSAAAELERNLKFKNFVDLNSDSSCFSISSILLIEALKLI
jgi:aspartyl-tRNA(Asn)/glutamyl-tRNA(Gln) amidotransferase subunit A